MKGHTDWVNAVAFSHDGSLLASASSDQTVRLWDPRTGQEVQVLKDHTGGVNAVAFSQDGSLLASASDDETVRLWDPRTGQEVQVLNGHTDRVRAVAFSQDGSLLASASDDETVRLWDPRTGQEVQVLNGHTDRVRAVAFSQDGSLLASASDDMKVRLWDPHTGQEVHQIEVMSYIKTIEVSIDNRFLVTDRGTISIGKEEAHDGVVLADTSSCLTIREQWIQRGHQKVLWLPQEYRSGVSAIYGNYVAIALKSGQVRILQHT